jgi:hypothetical protein
MREHLSVKRSRKPHTSQFSRRSKERSAFRREVEAIVSAVIFGYRFGYTVFAADLKSAGRKAVGVQVPLWAPIKTKNLC